MKHLRSAGLLLLVFLSSHPLSAQTSTGSTTTGSSTPTGSSQPTGSGPRGVPEIVLRRGALPLLLAIGTLALVADQKRRR